jgi:hypothetical protein
VSRSVLLVCSTLGMNELRTMSSLQCVKLGSLPQHFQVNKEYPRTPLAEVVSFNVAMNISLRVKGGKSGSHPFSRRSIGPSAGIAVLARRGLSRVPKCCNIHGLGGLPDLGDAAGLRNSAPQIEIITSLSKVDDLAEYLQMCGQDSSS